MRSRLTSLVAALLLSALGLTAAFLVTGARAGSVTLADLPGLGYTLALRADLSTSPPCSMYWVTGGNGAPETLIGDPNHLACTTPEEMQARIDALLAAYPPAPATTAALPTVTVTTTETVTSAETTTLTTTTPSETVTIEAPPVVRSETVTVPQTLTETVTQTVTVQAPPLDPEWLTALALRSQALNALYSLD